MLGANAGLFVAVVFWGALVPVLADLLKRWDPYFVSVCRYGLAVPFLLLLCRSFEPGPAKPARPRLFRIAGSGTFLAGFSTFYTIGVAHSNVIAVAILSACSPVIASLVEWVGTGNRPHRTVLFAIPLTLTGALLGSVQFQDSAGGWGFQGGEIFVVAGSVCWAMYSFSIKYWLQDYSHVRVSYLTIGAGTIVLAFVYMIAASTGHARALITPSWADLAEIAWVSMGAVVAGVVLWNIGVGKLGVAVASLYLNLVPFVAFATAILFGISPQPKQIIGCLLVVSGIIQAQIFGPGFAPSTRAAKAMDEEAKR